MKQNKKIKGFKVNIAKGNIAKFSADAIVLSELIAEASFNGKFNEAVANGGGKNSLMDYHGVASETPLHYGDAICFPGYATGAYFILHVAIIGCEDKYQFAVVQAAVYKALELAEEKGIRSIAIPLIGTEEGLTNELSARAILSAVAKYAEKSNVEIFIALIVDIFDESTEKEIETILLNEAYLENVPEPGNRALDMAEWLQEQMKK